MRAALCLLAGLWAAPVSAFNPPAGCEGIVTVQYRGCHMLHIWQCEADPEGVQHIALFDAEGAVRLRTVDERYQWLATHVFRTGIDSKTVMSPPPADPMDIQELFRTGVDSYDFLLEHSNGRVLRYVGTDTLNGERRELNGFELLAFDFDYAYYAEDGQEISSGHGYQYAVPGLNVFLWGVFHDGPDQTGGSDFSPVAMIRPDEPGFFANSPVYDCDPVLSRAEAGHGGAMTPLETGAAQ